MTGSPTDAQITSWRDAARDTTIAGALEAVYTMLDDQIAARQPVCSASGRCCRFESFGHRLYVTGLEAAYTISRLETPLERARLDGAIAQGRCPFQDQRLCTVHPIRPLGCRVYFCDPTAQDWQQDLCETLIGKVRDLHDRFGLAYRYSEWRAVLGWFVSGGD